ncbi:MAG: hypothetical protein ABIR78_04205 [Ferruginibacter sp.]
MNNNNKRKLLLPAFAIFLMIMNYYRLTGTENIRPIHIVTLLVLGGAIGILLTNIVNIIKEKRVN